MQIQSGSLCIESNGDFFYVQQIRKDRTDSDPTKYHYPNIVYTSIRGNRIGFELIDAKIFTVNNVSLWACILTYTEE